MCAQHANTHATSYRKTEKVPNPIFPSCTVYRREMKGRVGMRQTFAFLVPGTTSKCKLRGKCFGVTLSFLLSLSLSLSPFLPSSPSPPTLCHTQTAFGSQFKRQPVYQTGISGLPRETRSPTPNLL
ncbi:hypothetical protein XENOCAPTIV_028650 [Xenoophorus captivus]|uniref:Transmembrane protein n=1 Tax=Xenoophorus captivus TaxID=1517983 RepID=A0ABV0QKV0_9TELE